MGGYDISGDVNALDSIGGTQALLDSTDITQSAHSRIAGLRDGMMGFTVFMDTANAHPVLSALPTTDELMTFLSPPLAQGSPAACLNAKQVGYNPTRGTDGSLMIKVEGQGNAFALEWGVQLTAGLRTDTTGTTGANFDQGAGFSTPSVPLTTVPVTNTGAAARNGSDLQRHRWHERRDQRRVGRAPSTAPTPCFPGRRSPSPTAAPRRGRGLSSPPSARRRTFSAPRSPAHRSR